MSKLRKCTVKLCNTCKYRTYFSGAIGYNKRENHKTQTIACNYLLIEKKSRIFKDGEPQYDPAYCDKYRKGKQIRLNEAKDT